MDIDEKSIKKLAKIVFRRGFSLGAFHADVAKTDKCYDLMLRGMIHPDKYDADTKNLLEIILK